MTDILTYETWAEVDNLDDVQEVVNYIKVFIMGLLDLINSLYACGSLRNVMKFC